MRAHGARLDDDRRSHLVSTPELLLPPVPYQPMQAAGVRLVCLVHEWIDREIAAFAPEYWGEAVGVLQVLWGTVDRRAELATTGLVPCFGCSFQTAAGSAAAAAQWRCPRSRPAAPPSPLINALAACCLPSFLLISSGGELYYDEAKAFYAAAHGGKVRGVQITCAAACIPRGWCASGTARAVRPAAHVVPRLLHHPSTKHRWPREACWTC